MKKTVRILLAWIQVAALAIGLAACSPAQSSGTGTTSTSGSTGADTQGTASADPVTINIATFWVGTLPEAPFFEKLVSEFPKTELGKNVTINVEQIPGADSYAQKIKLLISSGSLPDIIQTTGANYLDLAVKSGKIADLTPYFDADPDWKGMFSEKSLSYNTRDGKIYAVPFTKEVCVLFYNKEMFKTAGIAEFPKTWDAFFEACDKLKAAGITPLAMDTAEYAWFTSLVMCSMIGTDGASGNEWMNTQMPKDYNRPEVVKAFEQIQRLFKDYTTSDAVGANWVIPTNHFEQENVAMVANGPWMIPDFQNEEVVAADFYDKVGVAAFPGDGVIMVPQFGEMIGATDPKVIEACINFEKFKTSEENQVEYMRMTGNLYESPKIPIPSDILDSNPLLGELIDVSNAAAVTYGHNQAFWYPNTLDALSVLLPDLAFEQITAEEICQRLTEYAEKNEN